MLSGRDDTLLVIEELAGEEAVARFLNEENEPYAFLVMRGTMESAVVVDM